MLQSQQPRERLLQAVAGCDRLVLLGDLLELRHGPERDALQAARVPLTEIAAGLAAEAEVVIVAGNHDHELLAGWFERRGRSGPPPSLGLQTPVEIEPEDEIGRAHV